MDFNFNSKTAKIYQAVKWERSLAFRFVKPLKKLFLFLFIFNFGVFLYGFFIGGYANSSLSQLLGFSIISLTLFLIYWGEEAFLNLKLKNPQIKIALEDVVKSPEEFNLADFLSFETAKAVDKSVRSGKSILYYLLSDNPNLNFVFSRVLLNLNEIKKLLKASSEKIPSAELQDSILESLKMALKRKHSRVEVGDMISALAKQDSFFKQILIDNNLKAEDIENLTWWLESLEKRIRERKKFWEWKNLIKKGSLAKGWAAGYTPTLDQFSADWTEIVKKRGGFEEIIGNGEEIAEMERILSQEGVHNVLLIGEPGTGRKSIIQALTQKILLGESFPEINYKRIVALDIVSMLTRYESFEEIERLLETIFTEAASAGNVILVIDEFYSFVAQASGRPGAIDISPILARFLPIPGFRVIGITSFLGLHLFIEKNPTILNLFGVVKISEISEQETIFILENLTLGYENKYKKFVSYQAIRDIVRYSGRYIQDVPFPKKAIDLLEEVVVYTVRYAKSKVVLPEYVSKLVSKKTDIPVGQLEQKEKEILLNLENLIHQRIINQEEAVAEVSTAMRRARAEVTKRSGPMGTFLFLGPTGVGKTETSKALAQVYFGSENKMIRLDMQEFQNVTDIPRLIGSAQEEGFLTTKVREAPFSLILLDEIEKAHPNILNLFLQVLDEGYLTDGLGRKVDFKNSIIIATSNAGYQIILKAIREKTEWIKVKDEILDYIFGQGTFRPEFINRFDAVVVFKTLSKENLLDIAELMLQKIKKGLKEKEIDFIITLVLKEKIAELGYDPTFGARQMKRVIQDKVENVLASALLSGELKKGAQIEIDPEGFKIIVKN